MITAFKLKKWFVAHRKANWAIVGGLSEPSKMPCHSYSIPAFNCKVGSALAKVKGSVCHGCYALKGFYRMPKVAKALRNRLESLNNPAWVEAMAFLINYYSETKGNKFFRWHDSGDLQDMTHLQKIVRVCNLTPDVQHWIPTREHNLIRQYQAEFGEFPSNLTVRLSALMIDGKLPEINGLPVSAVHEKSAPVEGASVCPAYTQGDKCLTCRACWNKEIHCISYPKH